MKPLFELCGSVCSMVVKHKGTPDSVEPGDQRIMWIDEVAPERLAELFHHYQQALTPEVTGKGSEGEAGWKEVPQPEKNRLIAAARLALLELEAMVNERARPRQYFAQPGEAEWGC
jgi:hypothetical protein